MLVLDCSVVLGFLFEDENNTLSEHVLSLCEKAHVMHVPALFPFEIANAMRSAIRRKRCTHHDAQRFNTRLSAFSIHIAPPPAFDEIAALLKHCEHYGITAYDAAYLALAVRKRFRVATLDEALLTAAHTLDLGFSL